MREEYVLITGRTREQADGLHRGKQTGAYRQATEVVQMNADEMTELGIEDGEVIEVRTSSGSVRVRAHAGDLPAGLLFMPLGPTANVLIGTETAGTGIPGYKGERATVAAVRGEEGGVAHA